MKYYCSTKQESIVLKWMSCIVNVNSCGYIRKMHFRLLKHRLAFITLCKNVCVFIFPLRIGLCMFKCLLFREITCIRINMFFLESVTWPISNFLKHRQLEMKSRSALIDLRWRHDMVTFPALPALCEGKSTGNGWIPLTKDQQCGAVMFSPLLT